MRAREKNDINQWFKFFLVGIIETTKSGINTFDQILKLQKDVETKIQKLGSRANNALIITNYLFSRPMIGAQKAKDLTGLSMPSVYKLIDELESLKIIQEITGAKRGKFYVFQDYLNLFK
jgi:Fic family protein